MLGTMDLRYSFLLENCSCRMALSWWSYLSMIICFNPFFLRSFMRMVNFDRRLLISVFSSIWAADISWGRLEVRFVVVKVWVTLEEDSGYSDYSFINWRPRLVMQSLFISFIANIIISFKQTPPKSQKTNSLFLLIKKTLQHIGHSNKRVDYNSLISGLCWYIL